jgi:hypothetical protein
MHTRARTAALRRLLSHVRYEVLPTSRTEELSVLGSEEMNVAGLHLFTFNQVAETEAWRRDRLARLGAGVAEVGRSAL